MKKTSQHWYTATERQDDIIFPMGWIFAHGSSTEAQKQWYDEQISWERYQLLKTLSRTKPFNSCGHPPPFVVIESVQHRDNVLWDLFVRTASTRDRILTRQVLFKDELEWIFWVDCIVLQKKVKCVDPQIIAWQLLQLVQSL